MFELEFRNYTFLHISVFWAFCCASCASNSNIPLCNTEKWSEYTASTENLAAPERGSVTIVEILDLRPPSLEAPWADRRKFLAPAGNLSVLLENGISRTLGQSGIQLKEAAGKKLRGEVRFWHGEQNAQTRSRLVTQAVLYIEVIDENDLAVYSRSYRGRYRGINGEVKPLYLKYAFGVAMDKAMRRLGRDETLIDILSSSVQ